MLWCACRVPYTNTNRARVQLEEQSCLSKLPQTAIVSGQLQQETQVSHARKNNASYKCHQAQLSLHKLLHEGRQARRDLSPPPPPTPLPPLGYYHTTHACSESHVAGA